MLVSPRRGLPLCDHRASVLRSSAVPHRSPAGAPDAPIARPWRVLCYVFSVGGRRRWTNS